MGVEETILQKEMTYLDSTPSGNIITGFDNYMKGTSGAAAQRRKTGPAEQNRVFSRSSISYRPNNGVSQGKNGAAAAAASLRPYIWKGSISNKILGCAGFRNAWLGRVNPSVACPDADFHILPGQRLCTAYADVGGRD
jgi:chromatin modification-related protein EAF6